MKNLLVALPIPFAISVAVMASAAGVQDRAVEVPTAQQEWRFDANQPDWKPLPESDPTVLPARVSRTPDALRVTIPEGKRSPNGTLGGGIYVDVPSSSTPFRFIVQVRTRVSIPFMMVGLNLSTSGFERYSDFAAPVADGAVHQYEFFVWQNPVRQIGLWVRASEPGSVDILSIKIVRQLTKHRWDYRGFVVDIAPLDASTERDALLQALRRQFDMVADAGLDQSALDFFRSVSVVIDPVKMADPTTPGTQFGRYDPQEAGTILIVPRVYNPDAPIFLHEFLHGYHAKKLAGGWGNLGNSDIVRLFKEARDSQAFPADSYMMSNVNEYFAMAGGVYLHGSAARDPFTRENLKNRQPALYQWFVSEFGPR